MSTLLSSCSRNVHSVPANYVFAEDKRIGGDLAAPVCKDIPVIDLSQLVINHGVSEELMHDTMNVLKEFFNMPAEDKAMYYSEDATKAGGHTDATVLTLLQQDVYGLQIFKDGQWLGVEPLPHAFVINISDQLEIISNGKLKSPRHRVVANTSSGRTSLLTHITPSLESIIEPEKMIISASESQMFKSYRFKEYLEIDAANLCNPEGPSTLKAYKLY
ncbi:hypothetical protein Vadar_027396 [Vaccinium darrowii]|uniref:Uncharacterized protein n=1 Tax=Vaccinium darrowii TaxID=229202 RepID=A0ACB7ZFN1_9ERIC|nr:hypothetical protein Vadar_027396 [Vaccinium darrowii]